MSIRTTSALVQWLKQKPLRKGGTSMREETFIAQEYDVFAGLDVSKKSIAATFSSRQGLIRSLQMPYNVEYLLNHVRKHFADQKIAFVYEAGPTGYGLYDGLAAQGYRCLIAAPSMIPRAPGQRVKTNRLDSRGLSESLRGGQLQSIHIPSPVHCSKASTFRQLLPAGSGR
jgi:transposase